MPVNFKPLCFVVLFGLTGCSTVSDSIPTVKIERKKPKVIQTAQTQAGPTYSNQAYSDQGYVSQASYTSPKVERAEAAMVCENDNMRTRAGDRDMENDNARVLILEEGGSSSNIIADVEVNCRDYFQAAGSREIAPTPRHVIASYTTADPVPAPVVQSGYVTTQIVQPAPTVQMIPAPIQQPVLVQASTQPQLAGGPNYAIKSGDNLYRIAKNHCTSIEEISALNGIYDPTKIKVNQVIKMPVGSC